MNFTKNTGGITDVISRQRSTKVAGSIGAWDIILRNYYVLDKAEHLFWEQKIATVWNFDAVEPVRLALEKLRLGKHRKEELRKKEEAHKK